MRTWEDDMHDHIRKERDELRAKLAEAEERLRVEGAHFTEQITELHRKLAARDAESARLREALTGANQRIIRAARWLLALREPLPAALAVGRYEVLQAQAILATALDITTPAIQDAALATAEQGEHHGGGPYCCYACAVEWHKQCADPRPARAEREKGE